MALAQCRECGKDVSTEAASCPHCGVPRPTIPSPSAPLGAAAPGSPFRKAPSPLQPQERRTPQPSGSAANPPAPPPRPPLPQERGARQRVGIQPTPYIESRLLPDEQVLYQARLHWITLVPIPMVFFLFSLVGLTHSVGYFLSLLWLPLAAGVPAYITYTTSEFALTDRRVLVKVGWIRRRSLEVFLTKVESVTVDQGIEGRIFDYGTIGVTGTGGTHEAFRRIASPFEFYKGVQAQIAAVREGT